MFYSYIKSLLFVAVYFRMIAFVLAVVYFPASGYLRQSTGVLTRPADCGHSWSSSSAGNGVFFSSYFAFAPTYLDTMLLSYRGYAIPVRCVQAFM